MATAVGGSRIRLRGPASPGTPHQHELVVVQAVVARGAQKGEVVDVGGTVAGACPRNDVVTLAPCRLGGAQHAGTVAGHECSALGIGGRALAVAVPQRFAVAGEQQPEQVGVARQALQLRLRDGSGAHDLATTLRILARDDVGGRNNHDLMSRRHGPRPDVTARRPSRRRSARRRRRCTDLVSGRAGPRPLAKARGPSSNRPTRPRRRCYSLAAAGDVSLQDTATADRHAPIPRRAPRRSLRFGHLRRRRRIESDFSPQATATADRHLPIPRGSP